MATKEILADDLTAGDVYLMDGLEFTFRHFIDQEKVQELLDEMIDVTEESKAKRPPIDPELLIANFERIEKTKYSFSTTNRNAHFRKGEKIEIVDADN